MSNTWQKECSRRGLVLAVIFLSAWVGCTDPLETVRELQAQGRYDDSLEPLRELVSSRPDDPEVHFRYGIALGRTGNPDFAVWSLRKASQDPDWMVRASLELASGAVASMNWANAIEATDRVLELDPDNLRALLHRGEARLGQKSEPEKALVDFDRALELDPDNLSIQILRARALIRSHREEEAAAVIASLQLEGAEGSLDRATLGGFCAVKAVFAKERGLQDEAEAIFNECLELYPMHGQVLDEAAKFFDARGERDRGTDALRAALEQMPDSLSYRTRLSGRLLSVGDREGAEAILRAGLETDDPALRSGVWAALTNYYLSANDFDQAADAYGQSIALVPNPSPIAVLTYADLLGRAGRNERALEVAKQLENDAHRALIEARVYLAEGRPADALARLEDALLAWPNNAGARYYAALAAEQLGDFDRAIEEYRQAIRSDAALTEAGLRLAKLWLAAGFPREALISAGHHFDGHPNDPDGMRFLVRLTGRVSKPERLRGLMEQLRRTALWSRAMAAHAVTISARRGPDAAVKRIRATQGVDLTRPYDAELLRSLVNSLIAAERIDEAREAVDAALAATADSADFYEIEGRVLEGEGASAEKILTAYERAVELDSQHFQALEALGRLAEEREDVDAALGYYDRSTDAHSESPSAAVRAAELAAAASRTEEAEERWEEFLREYPWEANAAMALIELRLDREAELDRTLELAQRAVRFRGGPAAQSLLARVYEVRGEPELAAEARQPVKEKDASPVDGAPPVDEAPPIEDALQPIEQRPVASNPLGNE